MIESLYVGSTGMHTQQTNLNIISNNLANVSTTSFKKNVVDFKDLMYRAVSTTNGLIETSQDTLFIGVGSAVSSTGKQFTQGNLRTTDNPLDVAISGEGFFEVILPNDEFGYTRNGAFQIDKDGFLGTSDGFPLSSNIQIPPDATDISIQADGKVFVILPGDPKPVEIGQIELSNFINPDGLIPQGENIYLPSQEAGQVFYGEATQDGFGDLAQGFLEGSNVELVQELLNLIIAQRAYEINSKVVKASDELLSLANNLRS